MMGVCLLSSQNLDHFNNTDQAWHSHPIQATIRHMLSNDPVKAFCILLLVLHTWSDIKPYLTGN